jgi:glycosyltransferase involved in cell wall biosynthesis
VRLSDGSDYNLRHLAGASNKVFEYMACGLPLLVPATAEFGALVEAPGLGELCRDSSPRALAAQISALLHDEKRRRAIGERGREAFLQRYHYEHQLVPVLERLER